MEHTVRAIENLRTEKARSIEIWPKGAKNLYEGKGLYSTKIIFSIVIRAL